MEFFLENTAAAPVNPEHVGTTMAELNHRILELSRLPTGHIRRFIMDSEIYNQEQALRKIAEATVAATATENSAIAIAKAIVNTTGTKEQQLETIADMVQNLMDKKNHQPNTNQTTKEKQDRKAQHKLLEQQQQKTRGKRHRHDSQSHRAQPWKRQKQQDYEVEKTTKQGKTPKTKQKQTNSQRPATPTATFRNSYQPTRTPVDRPNPQHNTKLAKPNSRHPTTQNQHRNNTVSDEQKHSRTYKQSNTTLCNRHSSTTTRHPQHHQQPIHHPTTTATTNPNQHPSGSPAHHPTNTTNTRKCRKSKLVPIK